MKLKNILLFFFCLSICNNILAKTYKATTELNIRTNPDKNSKVIGTISQGENVDIETITSGWGHVSSNGYVSMKYLEEQSSSNIISHLFGSIFALWLLVYLFIHKVLGSEISFFWPIKVLIFNPLIDLFIYLFPEKTSSFKNETSYSTNKNSYIYTQHEDIGREEEVLDKPKSNSQPKTESSHESSTSSHKPKGIQLHWYHCKSCNLKIEAPQKPSSSGCSSDRFHSWTNLGEVGNHAYSCKSCGTSVYTINKPTSSGCSRDRFHSWTKLS